ncbi:hypothetical protein DNL40_05500 [Xylanimonas oleitrophica]|uniref:Secreted protein n=1 Tax=Xylanimonas oleitrophica TaxID=2607479 RepID=A0A2W5WU40_9MICO|nr:hypothetical protein [Xylanimonas oleitrophica]PZR54352.1 hypothetical protein DNL40_05500 [Xylanimonas oleitrophica]
MNRQLSRSRRISVAVACLIGASALTGCAGLGDAPGSAAGDPSAQVLEEGATAEPSPEPSPSDAASAEEPEEPAADPAAEPGEASEGTETAGEPSAPAAPEATPAADGRGGVEVVALGTPDGATVRAGGFVSDAVELGGTCTYTLVQEAGSVQGSAAAEPDATVTWCSDVDLALPAPGAPWTLELRYESPMSVGTGATTSEGAAS